jgi:4-amino-4-deoxy-L-arabinose transferase
VFPGLSKSVGARNWTWHHFLAILLFLALAFSWFVSLVAENSDFLSYFLFRQTFERVTHADVFSRHQPFWYYLLYTPLLALPWSAVIAGWFIRTRWKGNPVIVRKVVLFWILLPLIFFSMVSSKLVLYVLPVFPALAMVTAFALASLRQTSATRIFCAAYFVLMLLVCCLLPALGFVLPLPYLLIPVAGIILLLTLSRYRPMVDEEKILAGALIFTLALYGYGACFLHFNELKANGTRPLAEWIQAHDMPGRKVMVYNRILPSLSFHLNQSIISLDDGDRYLKREVNFQTDETWKNTLFNLKEKNDADKLMPLLGDSSILVVKGHVQTSSQWILLYFKHQQSLDGWTVYY